MSMPLTEATAKRSRVTARTSARSGGERGARRREVRRRVDLEDRRRVLAEEERLAGGDRRGQEVVPVGGRVVEEAGRRGHEGGERQRVLALAGEGDLEPRREPELGLEAVAADVEE